MNVIFHINEPEKWSAVLSNVANYLQEMDKQGKTGAVEILVNGKAIISVETASGVDLAPMINAGVKVVACAKAMAGHQVDPSTIQHGIVVVPVGVYELVKRQDEGFAYVKP
ncbi:hypothetical protein AYR62_02770 [Secundilactobacillus paracollinoides]|uniref:Uncharacterized protein n=1 Tax=Secundilactobacillus paracollinoides TaxID=240427 RepID=A0A1B2IUL4_9LACO|nr:DsrE family protein [Secundilactobacillus paracollinoides]ANZ59918.1 hypothetical protein AYR61_00140 [Secundilactobacillus paracollinoides]ANZ63124.1 hypothetical protein AYR62_02770 [Secundilactobacillus paracollinoides]ANZ65709.1 hypothetical protein AYR63_00145 [Secundilactobacillus paracollinoides]KRL75545.1 hypothetical protein FC17_GL002602 [Secundilactobacillus paracollinoides DSM 15502 = JCM 11969]